MISYLGMPLIWPDGSVACPDDEWRTIIALKDVEDDVDVPES